MTYFYHKRMLPIIVIQDNPILVVDVLPGAWIDLLPQLLISMYAGIAGNSKVYLLEAYHQIVQSDTF